jgi:peptide/nickel transport system substrate-binding protein
MFGSEETTEIKDLRLGIPDYDTINPLLTNNKEVLNIDKLIFEPLINITEDYNIEMCLATECSKISDTSYIIKIDNNKKWHDGSPFITKDIKFTIETLKNIDSVYSYNVEKITDIQIIDSSTIKLILSEEVPFFEYNLTFPIMPNNYYLLEDFVTSEKTPIGTGMYKISEIDSEKIVLVKNEDWWNIENENAKIEKITLKMYTQVGELYNSFKLGNIDMFTTLNYNLEDYIGTMGYAKNEFKGREYDYLAFNCENNILKNIEVRKAIGYAINKDSIISNVYSNNRIVSDFPLDYGSYLYSDSSNKIAYNIEQAKKVLTDSGWEYANNRWKKTENYNTIRINLTLTVDSENANRVLVAENIKEQLEQIGIKITLNKVSNSKYKSILENKNYELIITGVYNSYSPNLSTFFGENNLQNYNNDELNNILTDVKDIDDNTLLKEKYNRIIEIYNEELPFLSLYRNKITVISNQKLSGEIQANNYCSYYRFYTWHRS